MLLYSFIGYVLYTEIMLQGKTCSNLSIEEAISDASISIKPKDDASCGDMLLGYTIGLKSTVIEVR